MGICNRWACWLLAVSCVQMELGCRADSGKSNARVIQAGNIPLMHALGFSLRKTGTTTVVEVHKPWQGATADFTYILQSQSGKSGRDSLIVPVPLERVVTLTTTNLYQLQMLHVLGALVGVGGGRYVCNPVVRADLESGRIREVGGDMQVDVEAVLGVKPDLVFTFVVGNSSDGGMAKLAEASIPTAIDGAYMEETPLGRAEWIKFTAAFFGKETMADSLYSEIDSAYAALVALAGKAEHRPTVFVNAPFGGVWWMPGGRTYVARFLADAGADYIWAQDSTLGSLNLDLETVLAHAGHADFWFNPGDWRSLKEGREHDPRNAYFQAFKTGQVYNNDRILTTGGGNDFFETGPSRPDWILADLISILHPELLPKHTLRWYRKLEEKG